MHFKIALLDLWFNDIRFSKLRNITETSLHSSIQIDSRNTFCFEATMMQFPNEDDVIRESVCGMDENLSSVHSCEKMKRWTTEECSCGLNGEMDGFIFPIPM